MGDHSCFASHSCDEQVIVGRKVVLIGFLAIFIADFSSSHVAVLSTNPLTHQKTASAGFCMRRVPPPTRCQVGRLLHTGFLPAWLDHHRFPTLAQKDQKSSGAVPPRCNTPPPLGTRTLPGVLRVGCGPVPPPFQHRERCDPANFQNSKISIVSHEIGGLMLSIRWTGQQEVQYFAGWSIPSPRPLNAHIQ